jgi:hypothetical protein
MGQDKKKEMAAALKIALKGTGIKYTLAVRHYSTIVMNIKAAPVDFLQNYNETVGEKTAHIYPPFQPAVKYLQLNDFHYETQFTGKALEILKKIVPILHNGNGNRADAYADYSDWRWHVDVNIGKWDKPFEVIA